MNFTSNIGSIYLIFWFIFAVIYILWQVRDYSYNDIHQAVIDKDIIRVKKCLSEGVDPDSSKNQNVTPLCLAIKYGYMDIVRLLIDYGADINQGLDQDNGINPLLQANVYERQEIESFLIEINSILGIHYLSILGNTSKVIEELRKNPDLTSSKRNNGMTLLHCAALRGHVDLIEILIEFGASINDCHPDIGTPLEQAVRGNQLLAVDKLITLGGNIEIAAGRIIFKRTLLNIAISQNNIQMVKLLISRGAEINLSDCALRPPLCDAVDNGYIEIAITLLENQANCNQKDSLTGDTPLHKSVYNNNLLMTEILIHCGANVNAISYFGSTPLGLSHRKIGYEKMEKLLLQYGANNYGFDD
jgi:ankyrin repeat protein